jgi:hypothetical protein
MTDGARDENANSHARAPCPPLRIPACAPPARWR